MPDLAIVWKNYWGLKKKSFQFFLSIDDGDQKIKWNKNLKK